MPSLGLGPGTGGADSDAVRSAGSQMDEEERGTASLGLYLVDVQTTWLTLWNRIYR